MLLVFTTIVFAQNDTNSSFKNQLRFSLGWYWHLENNTMLLPTNKPLDNMDIATPAFSYIRQIKNNDYHEATLNKIKIQLGKIISNVRFDDISLGVIYNYNLAFVRKKQSKVNGYMGFGASFYYNRYSFIPFTSEQFPAKSNSINLKIQCTPRVQFNIKKHWCIDVNIPIELSKFSIEKNKVSNPSLPFRSQITTDVNYLFLPFNLSANIGVGYKF